MMQCVVRDKILKRINDHGSMKVSLYKDGVRDVRYIAELMEMIFPEVYYTSDEWKKELDHV